MQENWMAYCIAVNIPHSTVVSSVLSIQKECQFLATWKSLAMQKTIQVQISQHFLNVLLLQITVLCGCYWLPKSRNFVEFLSLCPHCWLQSAVWLFGCFCAVLRWALICKLCRNKGFDKTLEENGLKRELSKQALENRNKWNQLLDCVQFF